MKGLYSLLTAAVILGLAGSAFAAQMTYSPTAATQGTYVPPLNAAPVSITQSNDTATITSLASVSCNAGGLHTDNSYLRRFDLDADHGITLPLTVLSIDTGVEVSAGAAGGPQLVVANLYTIAAGDALTFGALTLIGSTAFNMPGDGSVDLLVVNIPVAGFVDDTSGKDLVVELFTPNGQDLGNSFFVGSNSLGQTAPGYIAAVDCGITEPTDLAAIGFPDMHWVLVVNGQTEEGTPVEDATWASVKALYR